MLGMMVLLAAAGAAPNLAWLEGEWCTKPANGRQTCELWGPARGGTMRPMFLGAIVGLGVAEALLWLWWDTPAGFYAALMVFFVAFNFLEASLPGVISRAAPTHGKGAALGAYSTFQFVGVFLGGLLGGAVAGGLGYAAVPASCALLCVAWLAATVRVPGEVLTRPARQRG